MSVLIKIDCECGQRYSFDVEPVNGHVPSPISCPACGADGTALANQYLAQHSQSETPKASSPGPLRVTLSKPIATVQVADQRATIRPSSPLPGQVSRTQATHEAHAKMLWGDAPLQVLAYLMSQGFSREDSSELVNEFVKERAGIIRWKGVKYVASGAVLFAAPAVTLLIAFFDGHTPNLRAIGIWTVIGLVGLGLLIKGIFLLFSPGSQEGDASDSSDMDSMLD